MRTTAARHARGSRLRGNVHLLVQACGLSIVVLLLVLLAVRLVSDGSGRRLDRALAAGKSPAAPDFSLRRLNGEGQLRLVSLRGKAVVLNFWASWCVPCKQEAPLLEAAAKRFRSAEVVVVGVDAQDFRSDARRFIKRYGLSYPIVRDGRGSTLTHYDVTGFPETWFVDRSGHVVGEHVTGPLTRERLLRNIGIAMKR
ncbi:MAG TPA: TlpA disulfide reductase family protein [Gaiellaceae bacterium]|nr:TlpA disulfide reductase family protein [Gaiellaceae bacterium]